ncbi:protein AATF/BFR2, partial [Tremellales sp. Uapishka_1]
MSAGRLTLAQQLKQLEGDRPKDIDPDSAYSSLDALKIKEKKGDEGREHYLEVGPSRMKGNGEVSQTLLSDKYGGQSSSRMKIFDDESEEEGEGEGEEDEDEDEGQDGDEDEDMVDEEEEEDEDEDEDEGEEGEEEEEEEEEHEDMERPRQSTTKAKALDPLASIRDSRQKDIEKGQAIRRQKNLFESLITLRITFQKAITSSSTLPNPLPADSTDQLDTKRDQVLASLADLNERLFVLREGLKLPGVGEGAETKKRKRQEGDELEESYWATAARDSLELVDRSHDHLLPILSKWSTKIQAATLATGTKPGSSKFIQSTKATGVLEAIEAGLISRKDAGKTLVESEEAGYRALLREVIESRTGGAGVDLTHLRKEKKKKREAERGGSKGRKLRYTVHEKAQNFVVPIPLAQGWHEEQIDELFGSLFGGAGGQGAVSEAMQVVQQDSGLAGLGGLKVF